MSGTLPPEALERLAQLRLETQRIVDGLLSGQHRSPHRGQSVEFAEHKEYSPGDEIRHIDWKAYGKLDRYYVKRFEQETNLSAYLVLDGSGSMAYGEPRSKYDAAALLASGLGTVLARQQDLVGLVLWRNAELSVLPARSTLTHMTAIMEEIVRLPPSGPTDLAAMAEAVSEKVRRRGLLIILSDLFEASPAALRRLLALQTRGHDVVVMHLLDRTELEFPFEDPTLFVGMEDERRLLANPRALREDYLRLFGEFLVDTEQACLEHKCEYQRVESGEAPEEAVARLIARRSKRRGVRAT